MSKHGIDNYKSFVADLTDNNDSVPETKYDLIIADVPCTGSGTWARTPEQLSFFKEEKDRLLSSIAKKDCFARNSIY